MRWKENLQQQPQQQQQNTEQIDGVSQRVSNHNKTNDKSSDRYCVSKYVLTWLLVCLTSGKQQQCVRETWNRDGYIDEKQRRSHASTHNVANGQQTKQHIWHTAHNDNNVQITQIYIEQMKMKNKYSQNKKKEKCRIERECVQEGNVFTMNNNECIIASLICCSLSSIHVCPDKICVCVFFFLLRTSVSGKLHGHGPKTDGWEAEKTHTHKM